MIGWAGVEVGWGEDGVVVGWVGMGVGRGMGWWWESVRGGERNGGGAGILETLRLERSMGNNTQVFT